MVPGTIRVPKRGEPTTVPFRPEATMIRVPTAVVAVVALVLFAAACDAPEGARPPGARAALAATTLQTAATTDARRVWAEARDYASPSPDGRYVTYVDWSTGDVAMHDLKTGEDTRLTDKGPWTEDGSWAEEPLFSPDGRRVVYSYGNTARGDLPWRYELRVVELGDTEQRVVLAISPEDEWIAPLDWSAARGIAVFIVRGDGSTELALVDPVSGDSTLLETVDAEGNHPREAWFSPDEARLAYRKGGHAYVRNLDDRGGAAVRLDTPIGKLLGWTPGGGNLLVHTSHRGQTGLWAVPVDGDRASTGEPVLVRAGLPQLEPSGRAGDRYYYGVVVDAPKIHLATVDPASGQVLSGPIAITSPLEGRAGLPTWSPDGRSLAYALEDLLDGGVRFMVRAADGDAVREIARGDFRLGAIHDLRWAEGGRSLVFTALEDGRNTRGLYRLDPTSGELTREPLQPVTRGSDVMPDGERLLYLVTRDPTGGRAHGEVVVRDLATGSEHTVARLPEGLSISNVAVAPDGQRAALVHRNPETDVSTLALLDLESGELRELHSVELPFHLELREEDLAWSADGEHVLVMAGPWGGQEEHVILSVPVDGGDPVRLMEAMDGQRNLALHPDGRRLAFSGGEVRTELWVLEGVAEALAADGG